MSTNTFCIIGLGSMGKRRARLLKQIKQDCIIVGVDKRKDRQDEFKNIFKSEVFDDIDAVLRQNSCDAVFICTSPLSHSAIKTKVDSYKVHTFSEINLLDDGYDSVADKPAARSFLSSTQLYSREIITLQSLISKKEKYFYTYHVGQYLPDWHPWDKKEDFFVFDKRTNGCREILGIELPWIIETFGKVKSIKTSSANVTDMEVAFHDVYNILLEHENGTIGSFCVDVVSRSAVKHLRIQNENQFIEWDGNPEKIKKFNIEKKEFEIISVYDKFTHIAGYSDKVIEEPYIDEIKDFLTGLEKPNHEFKYSYQKDSYIIKLLDEIEGKK